MRTVAVMALHTGSCTYDTRTAAKSAVPPARLRLPVALSGRSPRLPAESRFPVHRRYAPANRLTVRSDRPGRTRAWKNRPPTTTLDWKTQRCFRLETGD